MNEQHPYPADPAQQGPNSGFGGPAPPLANYPIQSSPMYDDKPREQMEASLATEDPVHLDMKLSANTRMGFIRKVYSILFIQLSITAIWITIVALNQSAFYDFFRRTGALTICVAVVQLVCLYALGCYRQLARSVPTNYLLLSVFTMSMAYLASTFTVFFDPLSIMSAGILTAVMVGGLTAYAVTTKTDWSAMSAFIWSLCLLLIFGGILSIFIKNRTFSIFMSVLVIAIMAVFVVYDTQLIVGGKSQEFEIDEYVFAAMTLYIDIVRIFMEILNLLGNKR